MAGLSAEPAVGVAATAAPAAGVALDFADFDFLLVLCLLECILHQFLTFMWSQLLLIRHCEDHEAP